MDTKIQNLNLTEILNSKAPQLINKVPKLFRGLLIKTLSKFMAINQINDFLEKNNLKQGIDFIDAIFSELNVKFDIIKEDINKIPSEGGVIIVSNHPLGGLDGLGLIKTIYSVRKDVKIVANDILMEIPNLREFFLPIDLYSIKKSRQQIKAIEDAIISEQAVIFFPAGVVSRLSIKGIKDKKWSAGVIKFSSKHNIPILPVFIKARNSLMFYLMSAIYDKIGTFLLPQELFKAKHSSFKIIIGDLLNASNFRSNNLKPTLHSKLLRKHIYLLNKNKKGIFKSEKTIAHPIDVKLLKNELKENILLGKTIDNKYIYLVDYQHGPHIIKEIARLREITYRKVGEGTGKTLDYDTFDLYYKHIVLWNSDDLDIVGAYRLGECGDIVKNYGKKGLYNSHQFEISDNFNTFLHESIEVGRSFIQPKYWKSNALDFIWQGIGAYLQQNPDIRFLWGSVSISDNYSHLAKSLIVHYYTKWYSGPNDMFNAYQPFNIPKLLQDDCYRILNSNNYKDDFKKLKEALKTLGYSIPILYRRYTELTEFGGSCFLGFNIDHNFANSIDGLILVDLHLLRDEYKERYFSAKSFVKTN
jgi:putative hemolysin